MANLLRWVVAHVPNQRDLSARTLPDDLPFARKPFPHEPTRSSFDDIGALRILVCGWLLRFDDPPTDQIEISRMPFVGSLLFWFDFWVCTRPHFVAIVFRAGMAFRGWSDSAIVVGPGNPHEQAPLVTGASTSGKPRSPHSTFLRNVGRFAGHGDCESVSMRRSVHAQASRLVGQNADQPLPLCAKPVSALELSAAH
jgi:hypothetical protein